MVRTKSYTGVLWYIPWIDTYDNAIVVSTEGGEERFEFNVYPPGDTDVSNDSPGMRDLEPKARSDMLDIWFGSANVKHNHFCKLKCLLQPPISMVNAQFRQESLPTFYGVNQFHVEIENFHVQPQDDASPNECYVAKSPRDRYRTIGDENIKAINRLSFGGFHTYYLLRKSGGKLLEEEWEYGGPCKEKLFFQVHDLCSVPTISDQGSGTYMGLIKKRGGTEQHR